MKKLLSILLLMTAAARGATIFPINDTSGYIGQFPTNYNQSISNLNAAIGTPNTGTLYAVTSDVPWLVVSNGYGNLATLHPTSTPLFSVTLTGSICQVTSVYTTVSSPTNFVSWLSNNFIGCTQYVYLVECFTNQAAASGGGGILTNFYYYTITSEVTTINFTIPQTRSVLKIVASLVGNRPNANGDNFGFRFNGDSSTNYPFWYFYITGDGTFNSDEVLGQDFAYMGAIRGSIGDTGFVSTCYCEIPDYTNATHWKTWMTFSHAPLTNAASKAYMYNTGGSWRNSDSITSLTAVCSNSNLVSGFIAIWGY